MILKILFPNGFNDTPYSIDGLLLQDVPQNCEVIDQFVDEKSLSLLKNKRTHFLVKFDDCFYHIRVCQASESSGYEAFAALLNSGSMSDSQFERMKKSFTC